MTSSDSQVLFSRREFIRTTALAAGTLLVHEGGAAAQSATIVSVAVHPAIGVARVGNSEDSFFFAPEVAGALPSAPQGFKDSQGAIARQAVRFRIYGYDASGHVVREITAQDADITWQVKVANSKAAWYEFNKAFDLPNAPASPRRNPDVSDRSSLIIDPPERTVRGASAAPQPLDGGRFLDQDVLLGEVMTDQSGRLVFLPGRGAAYSAPDADPLGGFSDNDGWTDDLCDGPVRATVRLNGIDYTPDPAWVVSALPNYAPGIAAGLVTLFDTIYSMEIDRGRLLHGRVEFDRDIMPIFRRLVDMQWVNEGFFQSNGFGSAQDWTSDGVRRWLSDNSPALRPFRTAVFAMFRNPASAQARPDLVPQMYGDGTVMPPTNADPTQWLSVTPQQYRMLEQWALGNFDRSVFSAFDVDALERLAPALQPRMLDRAALDGCLGGAFHPGIEFSWIARVPSVWTSPFRLKLRSLSPDVQDWGNTLTADTALRADGPLNGCTPGDVTRWLGIPWHADGASCRSGYQKNISLVLPAFWPARVPNQVLSEADYLIVMDRTRSLADRQAAFARRRDWERFIARPTRPPTLDLMANEWFKQGVITVRPGPGDANFPAVMKVETAVGYDQEPAIAFGAWYWVPQG